LWFVVSSGGPIRGDFSPGLNNNLPGGRRRSKKKGGSNYRCSNISEHAGDFKIQARNFGAKQLLGVSDQAPERLEGGEKLCLGWMESERKKVPSISVLPKEHPKTMPPGE